jgi:hypothetical protein
MTSYLQDGQYIIVGQYLVSPRALFFAVLQADGNFCVYAGSGPQDNVVGPALWCTGKTGSGEFFAVMQTDGNFCVYPGTGPPGTNALSCTGTIPGLEGNFFASLQDDGIFSVNAGTWPTASGLMPIFSSPTTQVIDMSILSISRGSF